MTINVLGEKTLGGAMPAASAAIAATLPDLQLRLDALINFNPTLGSLSVDIQAATEILANLQLALSLGIQPPDLGLQLGELADALSILQGNLVIALAFTAALDAGGVHLYHYSGTVGSFGSEFTSQLSAGLPSGSGPSQSMQAVVLCATAPATWTALQTVFGL